MSSERKNGEASLPGAGSADRARVLRMLTSTLGTHPRNRTAVVFVVQ